MLKNRNRNFLESKHKNKYKKNRKNKKMSRITFTAVQRDSGKVHVQKKEYAYNWDKEREESVSNENPYLFVRFLSIGDLILVLRRFTLIWGNFILFYYSILPFSLWAVAIWLHLVSGTS